jgi:uncharacterized protein (DUF1501 family)
MDTLHTRRVFVARGLTVLSTATTLPAFLGRTAFAMNNPADQPLTQTSAGRGDERVLVVVQLGGGNDGLSTVIPVDNDDYRRARPRLAITQNLLPLGKSLALHPAMKGIKSLYDAGEAGVILGVGYPNPNRSHFRSTAIWETGEPARVAKHGWLGRYFDAQCSGADPIAPDAGISIGSLSPVALAGKQFQPVSFQTPEQFQWLPGRGGDKTHHQLREAYRTINDIGPRNTPCPVCANQELDFLQRTALDAEISGRDIRDSVNRARNHVSYPASQLAESLSLVARMIASNLPTRVYYVSIGGFDTHAQQQKTHDTLMAEISDALTALMHDLKAQGLHQKTMVVTFSEFGRRVAENASAGTDHGTAAPMFILGGGIRAGLIGTQPSLAADHLQMGDLRFTTDFRSVYASILANWLKADSTAILGHGFKPLDLIKA